MHAITPAEIAAIDAAIDRDEVIALTLELCNIPSPMRQERRAGEFVHDWMARHGFAPRKVGMTPERFNVIGRYGGGGGPSLLFSSHLDTESPFYDDKDRWAMTPETVADRQWLEAWLEGETFHGHAVGNDRGPMACFLLAAKALQRAGIALDGTLYLTACPGEIGPEPAEECAGLDYIGRELGAAYLLAHGGVAPDYMISAEGTDFGINWTACGYADFCITLRGQA
ncbi:MAG: peptidase M20, partial [Solimonas sp.]